MPSLRLTLERSPLLERLNVGLHLLAVICLWLADIPWPARLALLMAVLAHLAFRHYVAVRSRRERCELGFSESTGWVLEQQGRAAKPLMILPDSVVSPWLIILHGDDGSASRRWIIARDSMDAETFRALRVTLNVTASPTSNTGASPAPDAIAGNIRRR